LQNAAGDDDFFRPTDDMLDENLSQSLKDGSGCAMQKIGCGRGQCEVLENSDEEKCDLIAMPTHGHGF